MPKIDPLLEDSGYIYQSLLEDLTAFEGLWNFPDSVDKFRAMEVTKIRAARGIQELVEAIERGALQGFGLDKSTGLLTDTPISHHYPRIAQYQAIYSPVVNMSEEVECFHKACFEMGLSSILLPKWPASLASFSHQNFPNLTLHNFLNLPTFQSSLDYPSQQNAATG